MEDIEIMLKRKTLEALGRNDLQLGAAVVLGHLPGWDSIKMMTLLIQLEKEIGHRFQAREITQVKTFGDLVALVRSKTGK